MGNDRNIEINSNKGARVREKGILKKFDYKKKGRKTVEITDHYLTTPSILLYPEETAWVYYYLTTDNTMEFLELFIFHM